MSNQMPWQKPPLNQWSICGMNHYHVDGERFLYVSMVKDNVCITQEGKDDRVLWLRLENQAGYVQSVSEEKVCQI